MKKICLILLIGSMLVFTCFAQESKQQIDEAWLKTQTIVYNGQQTIQSVINYKNATYVPIQWLGNLVGVDIAYKNECITMEQSGSAERKISTSEHKKNMEKVSVAYGKVHYIHEEEEGDVPILMYEENVYMGIREFAHMMQLNVVYKEGKIVLDIKSQEKPKSQVIPVGEEAIVTTRNSGTNCTVKICVREVYRGEEAIKLLGDLKDSEMPEEGQEYVVAKLSIEIMSIDPNGRVSFNNGGGANQGKYAIGINDFIAYDSQEQILPYPKVNAPKPVLSGTLSNGGKLVGYGVYTVHIDDQNPKLLFDKEQKDKEAAIWFSLGA